MSSTASTSAADCVSVVTGGSRGIGAQVSTELASRGSDIALIYREKASRAGEVAEAVRGLGRRCAALQADLTDPAQIERLALALAAEFGRVDHLILNAAGGLEQGRGDDYAYALNVSANSDLVDRLLPSMPPGSSIVFVTSHPSHFYGRLPVMAGYERVASTKKAAEEMLLGRIAEFDAAKVRLAIVSGDLIDGTINARLMQREYPGLLARRAAEVGPLPSVKEFAEAIADAACASSRPQGAVALVGSTSWETYSALHSAEKGGL